MNPKREELDMFVSTRRSASRGVSPRDNTSLLVAQVLVVLLVFSGCSRRQTTIDQPPQNVVATVGGIPITAEAVEAELARRGGGDKQPVLELLVRRQLLLAEAQRTGFDRSPEMQAAWDSFIVNRFADEQRNRLQTLPKPSEADLRVFYERQVERYTTPERSRIALIYLRQAPGLSLEQQSELKHQADGLREKALADGSAADFGSLAMKYSDHRPSRASGGDIGWLNLGSPGGVWPAEVISAMKELHTPGEVSPVVATPQGRYLVKLIELRRRETSPMEKVRERVEYEFSREQATAAEAAYYSNLAITFPVEINTQRLEEVKGPTRLAKSAPPSLPLR